MSILQLLVISSDLLLPSAMRCLKQSIICDHVPSDQRQRLAYDQGFAMSLVCSCSCGERGVMRKGSFGSRNTEHGM